MGFLQTLEPPHLCAATIRRRAYGVIEMEAGKLRRIRFKPWPKVVSVIDVWWFGEKRHQERDGDHCWLYFNQPLRCSNFLSLQYIVSNRETTLQTFRGALLVLDEIAKLKRTDAIVCEVSNWRISDRLLTRWGWESHLGESRRRHFIKRFYGDYTAVTDRWIQDK